MADPQDDDDFEIERLRGDMMKEKEMKEMLQLSLQELQVTVHEMEKRIDGVTEESKQTRNDNEWKTRHENQAELNQQLNKQALIFQGKLDEARQTFKESRLPKARGADQGDNEATPYLIKTLDKEKQSLEKSIRELEWRLDQESKAYHKANEERKQFVLEINAAKDIILEMRSRQRYLGSSHVDNPALTPRGTGKQNIPVDQRILDPRKGPIRKTAAMKNLPRIP